MNVQHLGLGPITNAKLAALSNDDLVDRLKSACRYGHRLTASIIQLLMEVDDRRVHLEEAYSSLFDFCRRYLGMSEGEAFRRIAATRLVRRFPSLLGRIERGEVNLTTLCILRHHLTDANLDELIEASRGKRKEEVQYLLARITPRPDAPSRLRKLPARKPSAVVPHVERTLEPLSETRYRLQVTTTKDVRDKIEHARDLMLTTNPTGDLSVVVERAIDLLIEELEKQKFAKLSPGRQQKGIPSGPAAVEPTATPAKPTKRPLARAMPRPVRREPVARGAVASDTSVERRGAGADEQSGRPRASTLKARTRGASNGRRS